jgi:hypothetical protein
MTMKSRTAAYIFLGSRSGIAMSMPSGATL